MAVNYTFHMNLPSTRFSRNLSVSRQQRSFQFGEYRLWRRRRLKANVNCIVCCQLGPSPFENLFQSLLSRFPSVYSLDLIAPALALSSGAALYLSQLNQYPAAGATDAGQWMLFTSPTPFNRFVYLRCPSLSFEGSGLLEDLNEKLVKKDRHFVRLDHARDRKFDAATEEKDDLVYQRVCVSADDGGVISLDWPATLDLSEHGLDTTLVIIPGTPEGSMDENIRLFVRESLRHGCFPIVMNPRGCAGSPLTTARMFTAADSDDVRTAIHFINMKRPWTALMAVGCVYGANMLTKYLAEVEEGTPLIAAICMDNPFDLEEATRLSLHRISVDQKLTGGLIDILHSNKELFQGRSKGYDVENALQAKSIRDFDKAISMVSHGFDSIEEYYAKSSTRTDVGKIKIPVLFTQTNDAYAPLFSIPRSLIAENPYTSLLLCTYLSSDAISTTTMSWCQQLGLEWLAAVELGLLKGRHPLLEDVDITVNPPQGVSLLEGRVSDNRKLRKLLNTQSDSLNTYSLFPSQKILEDENASVGFHSGLAPELHRNQTENEEVKLNVSVATEKSDHIGVGEVGPMDDDEMAQVVQSSQALMNMIDATIPGVLTEERKKKVLIAVSEGKNFMKSLDAAVPEDVRGKLTNSVSEILHKGGTDMNFDRILKIGSSSKIQEKNVVSSAESHEGHLYSDKRNKIDQIDDHSSGNELNTEKTIGVMESEIHAMETVEKNIEKSQLSSSADTDKEDVQGNVNLENAVISGDNFAEYTEFKENEPGPTSNQDFSVQSENVATPEDAIAATNMMDQKNGTVRPETEEENNKQQSEDQMLVSLTGHEGVSGMEEGSSQPVIPSEAQLVEEEGRDSPKSEDKISHSAPSHNGSQPQTFTVSQAFDALTGLDDSTQVAVSNVFGLIEEMITHLQEEQDHDEDKATTKRAEGNTVVSENHAKLDSEQEDLDTHLKPSDNNLSENRARRIEKKNDLRNSSILIDDKTESVMENGATSNVTSKELEMSSKLLENILGKGRYLYHLPPYLSSSPYGSQDLKEYRHRHLLSKILDKKVRHLDKDAALLLDYIPDEDSWKLLEPENYARHRHNLTSGKNVDVVGEVYTIKDDDSEDEVIEPLYTILDADDQLKQDRGYINADKTNKKFEIDATSENLIIFKKVISDALKVEVGRRLSAVNMKKLEPALSDDMEQIALTLSLATWYTQDTVLYGKDGNLKKLDSLNGTEIVGAISLAMQETHILRRVLPVGVVVGSSLAALKKYVTVSTVNSHEGREIVVPDEMGSSANRDQIQPIETEIDENLPHEVSEQFSVSKCEDGKKSTSDAGMSGGYAVVDAVTAALGASALLMHQQVKDVKDSDDGEETLSSFSMSFEEKGSHHKGYDKLEETSDKSQNNIVTSLAEKAMSVAAPVVPTKEDGEVDQEKLVSMLAGLGQRGGALKLVGKLALLWGGMRGALSLTEKLISFLRIAERPLFQRLLGFLGMVLVLWTPIVVPFLPSLVQSWTTHKSAKFAELACVVGFYSAVTVLVMLWGKRIRGHENPIEQYGLDITSSQKVQDVLKGFIGGVILVSSIHYANALLGCVHICWPLVFPTANASIMTRVKVYSQMLLLGFRAIIISVGVSMVEELMFRSWLPDEIAMDVGYHPGIIISGLIFAISQRSAWAIPGLWLLSISLAGARERNEGNLAVPIGLRAGMMSSSFLVQRSGMLIYSPNFPPWLVCSHPFQPLSGVCGIGFSLLLAILLYPWQPLQLKSRRRPIRD